MTLKLLIKNFFALNCFLNRMGQTYAFLDTEKNTWIEHTIYFDSSVRKASLLILDKIENGAVVNLSKTKNKWGNIEYEHWFISIGEYFIEFGSPNLDIYTARVNINTSHRQFELYPNYKSKLDEAMRQRIKHVLGTILFV